MRPASAGPLLPGEHDSLCHIDHPVIAPNGRQATPLLLTGKDEGRRLTIPCARNQPRLAVRFPCRDHVEAAECLEQLTSPGPKRPGRSPYFTERADRKQSAAGKPLENGLVQAAITKPVADQQICRCSCRQSVVEIDDLEAATGSHATVFSERTGLRHRHRRYVTSPDSQAALGEPYRGTTPTARQINRAARGGKYLDKRLKKRGESDIAVRYRFAVGVAPIPARAVIVGHDPRLGLAAGVVTQTT
ncbi:hypothetical protein NGTWS0302_36450 [Mycolicibacterium cyprinidarum]|uniref:Uncharacterized protein n=1 Tax=Mycolicibacterium cyprinidarum TaxID=2860311 RepID=A0ABQ4V4S8_9MYCO|nr:hypothetical protein NGTWS1702_03450 [Mycolicibacterium sp. NGTWSNA01]GJF14501.1 hypothetical protein NGTWS0302_36450 [Mycolicibacterium sp. NGTWS0302]